MDFPTTPTQSTKLPWTLLFPSISRKMNTIPLLCCFYLEAKFNFLKGILTRRTSGKGDRQMDRVRLLQPGGCWTPGQVVRLTQEKRGVVGGWVSVRSSKTRLTWRDKVHRGAKECLAGSVLGRGHKTDIDISARQWSVTYRPGSGSWISGLDWLLPQSPFPIRLGADGAIKLKAGGLHFFLFPPIMRDKRKSRENL